MALDTMKTTIDNLTSEIAKAQTHVERARAAELAQAQAEGLTSELQLPADRGGA
jgi:hypothetical protein